MNEVAVDREFEQQAVAEADFGMFSMFGRTGAPTKMGPPHEDQKNFCNVPTHRNCPKVIEVINTIKILCGTGVSVQRSPACTVD